MSLRRMLPWVIVTLLMVPWVWFGWDNIIQNQRTGGSLLLAVAMMVGPLAFLGVAVSNAVGWIIPSWRHNRQDPSIADKKGNIAAVVMLLAGVYMYFWVDGNVPSPHSTLAAAVGPACSGNPIVGAGTPTSGGPNHIVVLDAAGHEFGWTGQTPEAWRPPEYAVSDVEFVACFAAQDVDRSIETCQYEGGPPITRYAAHRLVKVFAAATGAVVADHDIIEMPGTCPQVALKSETEIKTSVAWELAQQHLESIVQTGTFVDPDRVTPQE